MAIQFGGPSIVKNLTFGNDAKTKLISGIDKLAEAVGVTLGASGRTVILEDDFGNPHVTKDGVTVANYINLQDPVENLGVSMVKQAARQTATKAGDGTTTATVLTQSIINEYNHQEGNNFSFRDVRRGIENATDEVVKFLERKAVKVTDDRIKNVSIISANNDKDLGNFIAEAFLSAGDNGVVTMETSPTNETYIEVVDGTQLGGAVAKSMHFYTNNEKEVAELDKPLIFLSASEIPNVKRIQNILEFAIKSNRSILLIAPLDGQPLAALAMNKVKGNIKVNVVDPPSFGLKRKDILDDIALLTGATVYDESLGDSLDLIGPEVLGTADKAITDAEGTILTISDKSDAAKERIEYLKGLLDEEDHHVMRPHLEKRLGLLSGGVSVIYVGGDTEVELSEKKDRVDDAIHAVRAAKKEGILPGGGAALLGAVKLSDEECAGCTVGHSILMSAITSPFDKILQNAGLSPDDYYDELSDLRFSYGVDVTDGKVKDMRKAGIIDPLLVTKSALRNAVSVALTVLSADAIVSNMREQ